MGFDDIQEQLEDGAIIGAAGIIVEKGSKKIPLKRYYDNAKDKLTGKNEKSNPVGRPKGSTDPLEKKNQTEIDRKTKGWDTSERGGNQSYNDKMHGNRRDNPEETHWYHMRVNGNVRKGGIGSGPLDANEQLGRVENQKRDILNPENKNFDPNAKQVQTIIRKSFPNRDSALNYEKAVLDRYKQKHGYYPGEGLPGGNKTNR